MAIAVAMNYNENNQEDNTKHEDGHENDVVMPGFRFHPTEEELVEFYLRRKVEGKRFNVELITFLDLYRYDPWELPALAAIGEKEWYFYVPRDRKYRNGDRPNRVTTSGYWKATGADRIIRGENSRSIGLKKTLVFYSGKAPKGIRSSWIMNEYRLPHHETERLQKAEISLCRVYKRPGMEDHPSLPRGLPTSRASSSSRVSQRPQKHNKLANHQNTSVSFQPNYDEISPQKSGKISDTSPSSSADNRTSLSLSKHSSSYTLSPLVPMANPTPSNLVQDDHRMLLNHSSHAIDDLHKLVSNYNSPQPPINHQNPPHHQYFPNLIPSHVSTFEPNQPQPQPQPLVPGLVQPLVPGSVQGGYSDGIWDWSATSETGKDYDNLFK